MDDAWLNPDGTAEILKQVPGIFDHLGGIERARAEPVVRRLLGDPGFRARIATLVYAAAPDSARAGLTAAAVFEVLAEVLDAGLKTGGAAGPGGDPVLDHPGEVDPDLSWLPSLALDWPDDHPAAGPLVEESVRTAGSRPEADGKALDLLLEDLLEDGITETGSHAPGCGPE